MANLPTHPDTDDSSGQGPGRAQTAGWRRWGAVIGVALVAVLIVAMVVLHVTGVIGPGSH
jgi:hypothetical protein